jgi:hypothetical protein
MAQHGGVSRPASVIGISSARDNNVHFKIERGSLLFRYVINTLLAAPPIILIVLALTLVVGLSWLVWVGLSALGIFAYLLSLRANLAEELISEISDVESGVRFVTGRGEILRTNWSGLKRPRYFGFPTYMVRFTVDELPRTGNVFMTFQQATAVLRHPLYPPSDAASKVLLKLAQRGPAPR